MPTLLQQPPGSRPGGATLRIKATPIADPIGLQIAIIQFIGAEKYLDPRHPDAPWTTTAYWFHPLSPRSEASDTLLDLDYGVTFHLRANQPYKLMIRHADGSIVEERFVCPPTVRKPTFKPEGWQPPAPPRGPLQVPVRETDGVHAPGGAQADPQMTHAPDPAASMAPPSDAAADPTPVSHPRLTPIPSPGPESTTVPEPAPSPAPPPGPLPGPLPLPHPMPVPGPIPGPVPGIRWAVAAVTALLLAAGIAWWGWPQYCCRDTGKGPHPQSVPQETKPGDGKAAPGDAADKAKDADPAASLDGVRKYLAGRPTPADAAAMAGRLAQAGRMIDAQFLLLRYAAEHGDAGAARQVGRMYDPATYSKDSSPLPGPNPLEAGKWLKQAAEAGDVEAQYRYGMLLKRGGTDDDDAPEKATFWLRMAAQAGNADARKEIGGP